VAGAWPERTNLINVYDSIVVHCFSKEGSMTKLEKSMVQEAKELVETCPEVRTPSVEFKRDWAFGNAGLEDERITREQVTEAIKE
jgi:hypothetical protein